jgi:multicomponent Na+:H+ antiporter subunit C
VAETPSFDAEDDAVIPVETSEFPLPVRGPEGSAAAESAATVEAGGRTLLAEHAALEETPGSGNVTGADKDRDTNTGTETGSETDADTDGGAK